MALRNLARMTTATVGTGTITLGAAVSGFLTFALAGVANGETVSYGIKDGANSEIGTGVYTTTGTTLTRTVTKSTNSDAAISLSGTAEVFITPRAEDLTPVPTAVQISTTTGAQTITIPAGATKCKVTLQGGGGGCSGAAAAGGGAALIKYLSSLTPGNTLALSVGVGGTGSPSAGGNTTLSSGTQTISTLTAGGGAAATDTNGAGGTATGGDLNIPGGGGRAADNSAGTSVFSPALVTSDADGKLYGGGAISGTGSSVGAQGFAMFEWYS